MSYVVHTSNDVQPEGLCQSYSTFGEPVMDFSQLEETDGIRMTWNIWPTSKVEVSTAVSHCTL